MIPLAGAPALSLAMLHISRTPPVQTTRPMNRSTALRPEAFRFARILLGLHVLGLFLGNAPVAAESNRRSAIVQAVEHARSSVVNIHGHKTVPVSDHYAADGTKRVNGMGTGVVVDPRGYLLTNYHVVEGVRRIQVTLGNGARYIARLIAHDPVTDLAIIKIPVKFQMPVIRVGSSRDIMTGETVIAMGNAYGYEHTVTVGIVSAQHRNVQVNEQQSYQDLIQTDASINPGNSGGPLLNIDGDMIGINVAVRVGAQGIGFAIPVDQAMQVAARLMSAERLAGVWHGIVHEDTVVDDRPVVVVKRVQQGSPAFQAGLRSGDVIRQVAGRRVGRGLDFECAFIGAQAGESVACEIARADKVVDFQLSVSRSPQVEAKKPLSEARVEDVAWRVLGLRLEPLTNQGKKSLGGKFRGGMRVVQVNPDGMAADEGIVEGDVLVGVHVWETISMENVQYLLEDADYGTAENVPVYVVRNGKTYEGWLDVSQIR